MGYMGLNNWGESDNAADFDFTIGDVLNKLIAKELKDQANSYNTCGAVNIALLIEDGRLSVAQFNKQNRLKLIALLEDQIIGSSDKSEWEDEESRKMHLNAYKRMLKNVKKQFNKFEYYDEED